MTSPLVRSMAVAEPPVRMERSWSNPTNVSFLSVCDTSKMSFVLTLSLMSKIIPLIMAEALMLSH